MNSSTKIVRCRTVHELETALSYVVDDSKLAIPIDVIIDKENDETPVTIRPDYEEVVLKTLNTAFEADPNALHSLICNRVPCNTDLAEHPHVIVEESPVLRITGYSVSLLGVLNGVLTACGLPVVAAKFVPPADLGGRATFVGFCSYKPAEPK